MRLYELSGAILELQAKLDMEENEDNKQCIVDTLESLQFDLEEKVDNCLKLVKNYESDVSSIDDEIRRLQALKKSKQTSIENIKEYLQNNMISLNRERVETSLFKVTVKKNPPKVSIADESIVPAEYMKINYVVDKTQLKNALQDEENAQALNELGIKLVQETSLLIK